MIDDDLRAVMRDHDVEAPSAADFLARHDPADTRLRKKRWIATGAAAACVAAIAVVVSITGLPAEHRPTSFPHGTNSTSTSQPASGLAVCPARIPNQEDLWSGWVPAEAPDDLAAAALTPKRAPDAAIVCAYLDGYRQAQTLTGATPVGGTMTSISEALRRLPSGSPPKMCLAYRSLVEDDNYLIGLTYGSDVLWVSAAGGHCSGSTNGTFHSAQNLRADAAQAYHYGVWDSDPELRHLCDVQPDTDASAALPDHPRQLTVCESTAGSTRVFRFGAAYARDYQLTLDHYNDKLVPLATHDECSGSLSELNTEHFTAQWTYANGTSAVFSGTANCMVGPGRTTLTGNNAAEVTGSFMLFITDRS